MDIAWWILPRGVLGWAMRAQGGREMPVQGVRSTASTLHARPVCGQSCLS